MAAPSFSSMANRTKWTRRQRRRCDSSPTRAGCRAGGSRPRALLRTWFTGGIAPVIFICPDQVLKADSDGRRTQTATHADFRHHRIRNGYRLDPAESLGKDPHLRLRTGKGVQLPQVVRYAAAIS